MIATRTHEKHIHDEIELDAIEDAAARSWLPEVFQTLHSLGSDDTMPLEPYLLPDDHEEVRECMAHRLAARTEADRRKDSKNPTGFHFEPQHLEHFSAEGLKWPPDEHMFSHAGLQACTEHLTQRQREAVFFHTMCQRSQETSGERIIDLNPKLEWQIGLPVVPCITCSAKHWLLRRRRELTGAEALYLQGWPCHALNHSRSRMKNSDLVQLAGNAMSGYVLIGVLISLFTQTNIVTPQVCVLGDTLSVHGGDGTVDAEMVSDGASIGEGDGDSQDAIAIADSSSSELPSLSDSGSE